MGRGLKGSGSSMSMTILSKGNLSRVFLSSADLFSKSFFFFFLGGGEGSSRNTI